MATTVTKRTYSVTVKTSAGTTFTFEGEDGKKVYEQLMHKETVHATPNTENAQPTIIPFWSIDNAVITVGTAEQNMTDAMCDADAASDE